MTPTSAFDGHGYDGMKSSSDGDKRRSGPAAITMAELSHATDTTFDAEVLDSDRPVLVDFWADWCQPCKMIEPHLKAIATEMSDKLRVVKVDMDESPGVAGRFGVLSIPTVVLFDNGEEKVRLVGARPKDAIVSEIKPFL